MLAKRKLCTDVLEVQQLDWGVLCVNFLCDYYESNVNLVSSMLASIAGICLGLDFASHVVIHKLVIRWFGHARYRSKFSVSNWEFIRNREVVYVNVYCGHILSCLQGHFVNFMVWQMGFDCPR